VKWRFWSHGLSIFPFLSFEARLEPTARARARAPAALVGHYPLTIIDWPWHGLFVWCDFRDHGLIVCCDFPCLIVQVVEAWLIVWMILFVWLFKFEVQWLIEVGDTASRPPGGGRAAVPVCWRLMDLIGLILDSLPHGSFTFTIDCGTASRPRGGGRAAAPVCNLMAIWCVGSKTFGFHLWFLSDSRWTFESRPFPRLIYFWWAGALVTGSKKFSFTFLWFVSDRRFNGFSGKKSMFVPALAGLGRRSFCSLTAQRRFAALQQTLGPNSAGDSDFRIDGRTGQSWGIGWHLIVKWRFWSHGLSIFLFLSIW